MFQVVERQTRIYNNENQSVGRLKPEYVKDFKNYLDSVNKVYSDSQKTQNEMANIKIIADELYSLINSLDNALDTNEMIFKNSIYHFGIKHVKTKLSNLRNGGRKNY